MILKTNRLYFEPLEKKFSGFIKELLNTDGWIKNIGNRNINNITDAENYIARILSYEHVKYWVVSLHQTNTPIGIVTFMKKEHLPHNDIGFAFLPNYEGHGYAFEASNFMIENLIDPNIHQKILAETITSNLLSKKLLLKLGFDFEKIVKDEDEEMEIYGKAI